MSPDLPCSRVIRVRREADEVMRLSGLVPSVHACGAEVWSEVESVGQVSVQQCYGPEEWGHLITGIYWMTRFCVCLLLVPGKFQCWNFWLRNVSFSWDLAFTFNGCACSNLLIREASVRKLRWYRCIDAAQHKHGSHRIHSQSLWPSGCEVGGHCM